MAKTGKYVKTYRGHTDKVQEATFSERGAWIVTAGFDDIARVWSIDATRCYQILVGHSSAVWCARFCRLG